MPCIVQPGGGGGKIRVHYLARRKHGIIVAAKWLVVEGRTLQKSGAELHVRVSNLLKWAAQGIGEINFLDKILKSKKTAAHKRPIGQLKLLEDALLHYTFELCKQGITMT